MRAKWSLHANSLTTLCVYLFIYVCIHSIESVVFFNAFKHKFCSVQILFPHFSYCRRLGNISPGFFGRVGVWKAASNSLLEYYFSIHFLTSAPTSRTKSVTFWRSFTSINPERTVLSIVDIFLLKVWFIGYRLHALPYVGTDYRPFETASVSLFSPTSGPLHMRLRVYIHVSRD